MDRIADEGRSAGELLEDDLLVISAAARKANNGLAPAV
jgi:hypothetical protein